jgi:hypothetical protein
MSLLENPKMSNTPLFGRFAEGNSVYPWEYFCAANTVLYFQGRPALEIAGMTMAVREGKRPIYGYSSRHFDGVARGNVLVEGTILTNMVEFSYLMNTINGTTATTMAAQAESLGAIGAAERTVELPHDRGVGFEIKVLMGEQSNGLLTGRTGAGFLITGVTFTGEGTSINYDAEVIVKAHNFIGRNIVPLR